jgi:K+-transporting ATPase KdpF subunit
MTPDFLVGAIIAGLLIVYLAAAIIFPEKF